TLNYYIYAYKDSIRSQTPLTQIYRNGYNIQLWPVITEQFIDGSNVLSFTSVNLTNLYTNETVNVLSNDFIPAFSIYNSSFPNLSAIHANTYLS
uniref:hypothetical protein n=1 Tax=Pseudomonas aeruginosa TaxID=287 RepID=UPI0039C2F1C4